MSCDRLALGRDPEIVRMFGGSTREFGPLTRADVDPWYTEIEAAPYGWMIEHAGRCIGSARLHSIDDSARSAARYAVGILDPALLGRGLGREVTTLVLACAFEELGLLRVDLRVLAFNERAIRSCEACGFRRERIEPNAVQIDGAWYDDVIMSSTRPDRPRGEGSPE